MTSFDKLYIILCFFKFVFICNFVSFLSTVILLILKRAYGNFTPIKNYDTINGSKNILLANILVNVFVSFLMFYVLLTTYKYTLIHNIIFTKKKPILSSVVNLSIFNFNFDLFNLLFFVLSLMVAFISLLALDTRLYSAKSVFISLCNLLILIIFLFAFTENYILLFIFYELLLVPSFFFVYRISPAKTAAQSAIYFVM